MVKKRVPNWLYSSLWSSPHPLLPSPPQPYDDGENDRLRRGAAEEADSPVQTPVPEPPPSAARPEHPKVEIRDRINESSDNGSSGSGSSSVEDISRQAQLVQEVSVEPSLLLSLYKHIMYVLYMLEVQPKLKAQGSKPKPKALPIPYIHSSSRSSHSLQSETKSLILGGGRKYGRERNCQQELPKKSQMEAC